MTGTIISRKQLQSIFALGTKLELIGCLVPMRVTALADPLTNHGGLISMIRCAYAALFLLLFAIPANANKWANSPCIVGARPGSPLPACIPLVAPDPTSEQRVAKLSATLPYPTGWRFSVVSEAAWAAVPVIGKTDTAYSDLDRHVTYVRSSYAASASDDQLRRTLAHELGHWLCGCADESQANVWRNKLLEIGGE